MVPEIEPAQEITEPVPFVIRSHHLRLFRDLIKHSRYDDLPHDSDAILSPKERAAKSRAAIKGPEEYVHDVLGSSLESANRTEEYYRQTFETFLSLPEDHQVEIVENVPDIICKGCAIGEHCYEMYDYEHRYYKSSPDQINLDSFIKAIRYLGFPEPTITKTLAHFSNAKPQEVRKIKTTMSVVKQVLAQSKIPFR